VFDYSVIVSCRANLGERCQTRKTGENFVKRLVCLATASLVAMLILVPAALAQEAVPGDDNPHLPEPNAVVVSSHEELEQIAGKPVPSQHPGEPPNQGGLPKTGGPSVSVILPAAALLLVGSGILVYVVVRRGLEEGGSVR
jgi:LPXTG-motif cell wall-anchored protein